MVYFDLKIASNPCEYSKIPHFFDQIIMKVPPERSTSQNFKFETNLVKSLDATYFVQYSWVLVRTFYVIESQASLKLGRMGSKSISEGQI